MKHRIPLVVAAGLCVALLLTSSASAQGADNDVARSKEQYIEILKRLDQGGDLLVVANMEGVLENFVGQMSDAITAMSESADNGTVQRIGQQLPVFLRENGFYAVRGYGLSVVPRDDGLHDVKTFLSRDAAAATLPLWRAAVGGAQREMKVTGFLPADTVLARTSTAELPYLWQIVTRGVHELAAPAAAAAFDAIVAGMEPQLGVPLDQVIDSLGDESVFSIQFSETATAQIPTGTGMTSMPAPSLLLGIAVDDDTLARMIETSLANKGLPMTTLAAEGAQLKMLNLPLPLPFPFQPTFVVHEGFFLLGSNPDVVTAAIKAFRDNSGLIANAEFIEAFEGLPMKNNGLVYMHPRFMESVSGIQRSMATASMGGNPVAAGSLMDLAYQDRVYSAATVSLNWKSGVVTTGRSSSGGKDVVASMLMMPVGMMAGIAIPSFVKARSTSSQNACINNLRQLDSAKEQWALANNKSNGAEVDVEGVLQYIRGAQMPICPAGGTYQLNAIGHDPQCSVAGHFLP